MMMQPLTLHDGFVGTSSVLHVEAALDRDVIAVLAHRAL